MWSNSEYIWPNAQRNWPNFARAFNELRSHWSLLVGLTKCAAHLGKRAAHLAKRALILQNVAHLVKFRTFYQLFRCTMRIWPNAQIGQMRLTLPCLSVHSQQGWKRWFFKALVFYCFF